MNNPEASCGISELGDEIYLKGVTPRMFSSGSTREGFWESNDLFGSILRNLLRGYSLAPSKVFVTGQCGHTEKDRDKVISPTNKQEPNEKIETWLRTSKKSIYCATAKPSGA